MRFAGDVETEPECLGRCLTKLVLWMRTVEYVLKPEELVFGALAN